MTLALTSPSDLEGLNQHLQGLDLDALLDWALATHGRGLTLACSLGPEDTVLLAALHRAGLRAGLRPRAFVLDTGRLHPETHVLLADLRSRYQVELTVLRPDEGAVAALVARDGVDGFYEGLDQRRACCAVRKVEPLGRALRGATAWITGQRREQGITRADLALAEADAAHGLLKLNPLAAWSFEEVLAEAARHDVPLHPLLAQGYPSIGCAPCTRPVAAGEDPRAGRWWWEAPEHKECGLHHRPGSPQKKKHETADFADSADFAN
jgi:phosphoadenosine phosphosulfate reductase